MCSSDLGTTTNQTGTGKNNVQSTPPLVKPYHNGSGTPWLNEPGFATLPAVAAATFAAAVCTGASDPFASSVPRQRRRSPVVR